MNVFFDGMEQELLLLMVQHFVGSFLTILGDSLAKITERLIHS
jgi:hypothetical protein